MNVKDKNMGACIDGGRRGKLPRDAAICRRPRVIFILRNVLPDISKAPIQKCDSLLQWLLTSIMAGPGASAVGKLASPDDVLDDPCGHLRQDVLEKNVTGQARLPIRGRVDFTRSTDANNVALTRSQVLTVVLARAGTTAAGREVSTFLESLSNAFSDNTLLKSSKGRLLDRQATRYHRRRRRDIVDGPRIRTRHYAKQETRRAPHAGQRWMSDSSR